MDEFDDVEGVAGVDEDLIEDSGDQRQPSEEPDFYWFDDEIAQVNYKALGKELSVSGDLFRNPQDSSGLIRLLPDGKHAKITKAADLLPVIVDRLKVLVMRDGKRKGSRINAADLNAMLRSEVFLKQFASVDRLTPVPLYLPDFTLTEHGFNDGGTDHRILYVGEEAVISDDMDAINSFLDVMQFENPADRTNAVAAALTATQPLAWREAHCPGDGDEESCRKGHGDSICQRHPQVGLDLLPVHGLGGRASIRWRSEDQSRRCRGRHGKRPHGSGASDRFSVH